MKKGITVVVGILLICAIAFALQRGRMADALPMSALNAQDNFCISLDYCKRVAPSLFSDKRGYLSQQGSATDGKHAYLLLENSKIGLCSIWKLNMEDWSVVKTKYAIELDHGNDMTYHPGLDQLLVVHNKPHYTRVSFVDPDTLEVLGRKTMPYQIYSMAYEPTRDQYIVGISGTYDFAVLDAAFKKITRFKGVNTGLVKQGVDCDENYIYFPQNSDDARENVLMVYDWEGNFVARVPVDSKKEIESLFHRGDAWYIAFNLFGSFVYRANLQYQK